MDAAALSLPGPSSETEAQLCRSRLSDLGQAIVILVLVEVMCKMVPMPQWMVWICVLVPGDSRWQRASGEVQ